MPAHVKHVGPESKCEFCGKRAAVRHLLQWVVASDDVKRICSHCWITVADRAIQTLRKDLADPYLAGPKVVETFRIIFEETKDPATRALAESFVAMFEVRHA